MKSISQKIAQAWTTYRYQSIVRKSSFQHALEDLPPTLYEHWRTVALQDSMASRRMPFFRPRRRRADALLRLRTLCPPLCLAE